MGRRILSFLLATFMFLSFVVSRPTPSYASAVIVGEAVNVLYGLLGGVGYVGAGMTMEERMFGAQELLGDFPPDVQDAVIDWYALGTWSVTDTGHRIFTPPLEGIDTSFYYDFYNAVVDACSKYIVYTPPVDGYTEFTLVEGVSYQRGSLGTCADSPFFVRTGQYDSGIFYSNVYTFLPSGVCLEYDWRSDRGVYNVKTGSVSSSHTLDFQLTNYDKRVLWNVWSGVSSAGGPYTQSGDYTGLYWGSATVPYTYFGRPHFGALGYADGVILGLDKLVDADTWVKSWEDALDRAREGEQVGIIVDKDLGAYDNLDSLYHPDTGIIVGVQNPSITVPDVPDIPDVGDSTIGTWLGKIVDWLQSFLDRLIKALKDLLAYLFIPSAATLRDYFEPIMVAFKDKMDVDSFMELQERVKLLSSPPAPNITMDIGGKTYTVIDFGLYNSVRPTIFGFIRSYLFLFVLLFNIDFFYKLVRGVSMFSGMGAIFSSHDNNGGGAS